jgi:hypothetical protein
LKKDGIIRKVVKKTSNTGKNEQHRIFHEKGGIPGKKWDTNKNMGYLQKHGIPSILPCYFTCKVGIPAKQWDPRKKMGFQKKHGIPGNTWFTSKIMEYQQKDFYRQKVEAVRLIFKSGSHGCLKE